MTTPFLLLHLTPQQYSDSSSFPQTGYSQNSPPAPESQKFVTRCIKPLKIHFHHHNLWDIVWKFHLPFIFLRKIPPFQIIPYLAPEQEHLLLLMARMTSGCSSSPKPPTAASLTRLLSKLVFFHRFHWLLQNSTPAPKSQKFFHFYVAVLTPCHPNQWH